MKKSQNHLQSLQNQNRHPIMITIQILALVAPEEVILKLEVDEKVLLQGVVACQPFEEEVKTSNWM